MSFLIVKALLRSLHAPSFIDLGVENKRLDSQQTFIGQFVLKLREKGLNFIIDYFLAALNSL